MNRKHLIYLLVFIAASFAVIGSLNLLEKARFNTWERLLRGPYQGVETSISNTSTNLSLTIENGGTLMLFEDADQGTLLSFKDASGKLRWARLLITEEQSRGGNDTTNRAKLKNVTFQEVKRTKDGLKVVFICDWDWEGRQKGVFYLSPELNFRGFAVGR